MNIKILDFTQHVLEQGYTQGVGLYSFPSPPPKEIKKPNFINDRFAAFNCFLEDILVHKKRHRFAFIVKLLSVIWNVRYLEFNTSKCTSVRTKN